MVVQPWKSPEPHTGIDVYPARVPALPGQVIVSYVLERYPGGCCEFEGLKPEALFFVIAFSLLVPCFLPIIFNDRSNYIEYQRPVYGWPPGQEPPIAKMV